MNLHRLRIFYYVAHFESVTKAAEALHISQPAVTAQIKKFEAELEVQLFQAEGRGLRLTTLGEALYKGSQRLFAVEEELRQLISTSKEKERQQLRLASNLLGMEKILPAYLAKFKQSFPEISIQLATLNSTNTLQAVVAGEADFGISGSQVAEFPQLASQIVHEDNLVFIASANHILAGKKIKLAELEQLPFVGREKASYTQTQLLRQFKQKGLAEPTFHTIFNYSQGAIEAVKAGQGIHYCSHLLVADELKQGTLIELEVVDVSQPHPLYLSWLKRANFTPPMEKFRRLISQ